MPGLHFLRPAARCQIAGKLWKTVMTKNAKVNAKVTKKSAEDDPPEEDQSVMDGVDGDGAVKLSKTATGRKMKADTAKPSTPDSATAKNSDQNETAREGELVWYNERKGYGFVRIGDEEVFLHRSTLDRFGLVRLLTGDVVTVSLSTNEHGQVIKDLLAVQRPFSPAPPAAHEPDKGELRAVVKFFNDLRGYGFVTADDLDEDVFVHSRVLNDCGFSSLIQGQKILVKVDDSGRGLQVNSVRLLAD